jgi:enhancing lycopene biosynthesis protein 2
VLETEPRRALVMAKKIGVILSGCGFQDGAEIQESVITLLALARAGAEVVCMAPDIDQRKVVNHLTGEETGERRNVRVESARIARGQVEEIKNVEADDLDGLVLPGGFGAALNLSDFAIKGPEATVNPDVADLVAAVFEQKKPIGAICIAPAVLSKILERKGIEVTIGNDPGTARAIEALGCRHRACATEAMVLDSDHKIVSTPAYMLGPTITQVADGIEKTVAAVMKMA